VSPERPVSDPVFEPAADDQGVPRVATNGEVALAVWADWRNGAWTTYATLVSRDGVALDSLSIPLETGSHPEAVAWNGNAFVVVVANESQRELLFVSPDGRLVDRRTLAVSSAYRFAAVLSSGPGVRLLFAGPTDLVVTGSGDIIQNNEGPLPNVWVGGGTASEFLLVGQIPAPQGIPTQPGTFFSYRFDGNGKLLSVADAKLPFDSINGSEAIAGGDDGFLLIRQGAWTDSTVTAYRLDANGIFTGSPIVLAPSDSNDRRMLYHPSIVREGDRYIVSWDSSLQTGRSYVYAASVGLDGTAVSAHAVHGWDGITFGSVLTSESGFRIIVTAVHQLFTSTGEDAFAQTLNESGDAGPPQLIAASATLQSNVSIAISASGYAALWGESGPDRYLHLYVRRFDSDGRPLDSAPIEIMREEQQFNSLPLPVGQIVSNGQTYLVTWPSTQGSLARRMSATTGEWLDADPFVIGIRADAFATNGQDLIAVGSPQGHVISRRIAMTGDPLVSLIVAVSTAATAYSIAVASNGTDYMTVWSDGSRECSILCVPPPFRLLAMRMRADGTPIDAQPIVIDQGNSYPDLPSFAWNRGNYFLAWSDGKEIRGATLSAQGQLLDHATLQTAGENEGLSSKVLPFADGFALLTRRLEYASALTRPVLWEGAAFSASTSLTEITAMQRFSIARFENDKYDSFSSDSRGSRIIAAYNITADRALGNVARLVTRAYAQAGERRRATRR
jgi:hypothetical protein